MVSYLIQPLRKIIISLINKPKHFVGKEKDEKNKGKKNIEKKEFHSY